MAARKRREYGEYIISDPQICGGELTFKGTRVSVKDVLNLVAEGEAWEKISEGHQGKISREAIAEALELAREALMTREDKWRRQRIKLDEHLNETERRIMLDEHRDAIRHRRLEWRRKHGSA